MMKIMSILGRMYKTPFAGFMRGTPERLQLFTGTHTPRVMSYALPQVVLTTYRVAENQRGAQNSPSKYWPSLLLMAPVVMSQAECFSEQQPTPTPNTYVVVHVWRPKAGHAAAALVGEETGHTSISIFENGVRTGYISFWPTNGDGSLGTFLNPTSDVYNEGRQPDANIVLYGLDTKAIKDHHQKMLRTPMKWVAQKALPHDAHLEREQNCATVAWQSLIAGGIKQYYHPSQRGPNNTELRNRYRCDEGIFGGKFDASKIRSLVTTPILVSHLCASAKEQEIRRYAHTNAWDENSPYPPQTGNPASEYSSKQKPKGNKLG